MTDVLVDHRPTAVTLFPDRARVTTEGEVAVTGDHIICLFDGLPRYLEPESVRFTASGMARVRVVSIDLSRTHYAETPVPAVQGLEAELETFRSALTALEDEAAVWEAEARYLDELRGSAGAFAKGLARGDSTVEDQTNLLAFLQERERKLRATKRELRPQRRALSDKIEKVERELADLLSQRPRQRYQARVELAVEVPGDLLAELTYVVRQASWRPLYDARLDLHPAGGDPALALSLLAEVVQRTGQDWSNVALTVSTARPALSQSLPELTPWFIDRQPEPADGRMLMAEAMADQEAVIASATGAPQQRKNADYVEAQLGSNGAVVTFRTAGLATIPSDGSPHKQMLTMLQFNPRLDYLTVPRLATAVYRRVTFLNDSPTPLLPGPVSLFIDGDFAGRADLDYVAKGDEVQLLMGVEERLTVEHELQRRQVDKRLLRENRVLHYAYAIELHSLLPDVAEIEVQDQIPVSRSEDIKVKLEKISPPPQEQTDLHILTWRVSLAAQTEITIHVGFGVEHPRTLTLDGLPD